MKRLSSTSALLVILIFAGASAATAQDRTTGGIKGKVRSDSGAAVAGVAILVRQEDREVAHGVTDRKGEFLIQGLKPGLYGLTFRKPGLTVGTIEHLEVRAGKTRELRDRLILMTDISAIALLRGSVFNEGGRSVPGVRVELSRVDATGASKKIDARVTGESGEFVFRLVPDAAKYRVTVKADGVEPAVKDVEIDGAAVYRVALTLSRSPK
ncbi:MAG TPA: carboxypeptidase-like regulatory domain-containing protein [Pyrinomonadaceae bacterium]|jgi:hypothetical protein